MLERKHTGVELNYPPGLRSHQKFAPVPDVWTYWTIRHVKGRWKCGRGMCAKCGDMFTLWKGIVYRGKAVEENLICNRCWKEVK